MIKTAKFGGTSLASAACIQNVASIIKNDASMRYVVVSAPGKRELNDEKITDMLYRCCSCKSACSGVFSAIEQRFNGIITELGLELDISTDIEVIAKNIASGADEDYIASRGEYLNARILSKFLGYEFVDAADIIKFKDGQLDANLTRRLAKERLRGAEYAVIPGFYGSREDGTIKTFSRGGSDYTGAIIADAVGADLYENWTDVDGFMACDPRIIQSPQKINELSYDELYRLSRLGASVLHPCSVLPLKRLGIKINIKNTFNRAAAGTIIAPSASGRSEDLAGISLKKDCLLITAKNQSAGSALIKKLSKSLRDEGGKIELTAMRAGGSELILTEQVDLAMTKARLKGTKLESKPITLIALVGYRKNDLLQRALKAVGKTAPIIFVSYEAPTDLIIGIPSEANHSQILKTLYNEFFLDAKKRA